LPDPDDPDSRGDAGGETISGSSDIGLKAV
jgi:hypothetical protein